MKCLCKRLCMAILLVLTLSGLLVTAYAKETATSDITMLVRSSCYIYNTPSTATKYRTDYVTFGQEIQVDSISGDWAAIQYGGATRYIKSSNLTYQTKTVIKNRVMVSPGAYACSESSTLGYVFYGTTVSVLGETTSSNGVTYVHCLIANTYNQDGIEVKKTSVEGYINAAYLEQTATPKVVNGGTNLYASAYGASASDDLKKSVGTITTGEEVQMLMSNATWSKILWNGKEYYISTGKLDALKKRIIVNRAAQTVDAKPGSGWQHYVYWNTEITVLNTYESDTYGTYYYCCIDGDYGFIRETSTAGIQYVGYCLTMQTTKATTLYQIAATGQPLKAVPAGSEVTVEYTNGTWTRVNYAGLTGYILSQNLTAKVCEANGAYYSTGYRLYKGLSAGTLAENVSVLSRNDKYGYAYVQTAAGNLYWMKTGSLREISAGTTVYTAMPSVTLHTAQSSSSDAISVPYMTQLTLLETYPSSTGSWSKMQYGETVYYLWQNAGESVLSETKSSFTYTGATVYQQDVIDLAQYIGQNWDTYYAHGASDGVADASGRYGFDCSGFAAYVLETAMEKYVPTYQLSVNLTTLYQTSGIYNEGHNGAFQAETVIAPGETLDESKLRPGDVLYFQLAEESEGETGIEYNHCGIYLGNGEFIHSTQSWDGDVGIMPLKGIYAQGFTAARRYLPDTVTAANETLYTSSQVTYVYAVRDSSAQPVDTLAAEQAVTLLYTDNGNWSYVQYGSGSGYILSKYLTDSIAAEETTLYVAKPSLKLYTSYSTSSTATQVLIGTEVIYQGRYSNSSYYKVVYEGTLYYVYAPNGIGGILVTDAEYQTLLKGSGTTVLTANASLRKAPNNDGEVIRVVKAGETVTVIAVSDTVTSGKAWTYVMTSDGSCGFLYIAV